MKNAFVYVLTALVLLACAVRIATAEEIEYWTSNADLYYHSYVECLGESGRVPISALAAASFGKAACPVCVEEDDMSTEIAAAAVRGVLLIRLPEGWIHQHADLSAQPAQNDAPPMDILGDEIQRSLAQYFHGEEYAQAMRDFAAGTLDAYATRVNFNYEEEDWGWGAAYDMLCNRRLNGARYYLFSQDAWEEAESDGPLPEILKLDELHVWSEGGALMWKWYRQLSGSVRETFSVERGSEAEFTANYEGTSLAVYPALGAHVAIFKPTGRADEDPVWDARLRINGRETGTWTNGYWIGSAADSNYWFILSDVELAALQSGAEPELVFQKAED